MFLRRSPSVVSGYFPGLNYVPGQSFLHRAHPLVKLVLLVGFSITVLALPAPMAGIALFFALLAAYGMARLGPGFFWRKLRMIVLFGLAMVVVQVLVVKEGLLLAALPLYFFSLEIWSEGLRGGLVMMLRFLNIIGSSYLFVAVTNPNNLAYALMQAGLPYRYGFMLITAMRFIPIFQRELNQVRSAQMAKGIDLEGASLPKILRAVRYLLVPLVITALGKVDHLAISMEGRAFGLYHRRSYMQSQKLTWRDAVFLASAFIFFAALFFYFY